MHRAHAKLYYTLDRAGSPGAGRKAFDTIRQRSAGSRCARQRASRRRSSCSRNSPYQNGVSADDFAKAYNSFTVNSQLQRAEEITQRYRVQGVPFIVVNGKYTTDVVKAGGEAKLIELINDLAAAEHSH